MGSAFRTGLLLTAAISPLAVPFVVTVNGPAVAYNSEEHRLIVDQAIDSVILPDLVKFPDGISLRPIGQRAYVDYYRAAKDFAVGFDTNDSSAFNPNKGAVQDNCYYTKGTITVPGVGKIDDPWHQPAYNKKIYVPAERQAPAKVLSVPAYNTGAAHGGFTMGQLAALYGDYRKTTYCDGSGRCFLTQGEVGEITFTKGNAWQTGTYCPDKINAGRYLQHIGSGLVPPFGGLGNSTRNTADDNEYGEAGWWGDEMLRIANINYWHFSNAAIAWYTGLHRLALLYADSARGDSTYWAKALHYEANALHSLTDLFAFGHVVTSREETSLGIMKDMGVSAHPANRWMLNVIRVGGGTWSGNKVSVSGGTVPITDVPAVRNDFMATYTYKIALNGVTNWVLYANKEREYHDDFNQLGARVRNFNGDEFQVLGDGRMSTMLNNIAAGVMRNAVRTSVQSLFDAHVELRQGKRGVADIGAAGSAYFGALKYVPVFIVRDNGGFFNGNWTRYAAAVQAITGVNKTLTDWDRCQARYLSGADKTDLTRPAGTCTQF